LLSPGLHEISQAPTNTAAPDAAIPAPPTPDLAGRIAQLEGEVRSLRELLAKLANAVGEEAIAQASRDQPAKPKGGDAADEPIA
jgi:hypothetical protein